MGSIWLGGQKGGEGGGRELGRVKEERGKGDKIGAVKVQRGAIFVMQLHIDAE